MHRLATIHNVTDRRTTTDRQTQHCSISATVSTAKNCTRVYVTIILANNVGFLADRTNGRAIGTVLRLSSVVVCDFMYCG